MDGVLTEGRMRQFTLPLSFLVALMRMLFYPVASSALPQLAEDPQKMLVSDWLVSSLSVTSWVAVVVVRPWWASRLAVCITLL